MSTMRAAAATLPLLLLLAALADAARAAPPGKKEPSCGTCVTTPAPRGPMLALRVGLGLYRPSLELQAQAGWLLPRGVALGIAYEYNPYCNWTRPAVSAGVLGFGGFLAVRHRLNEKVALRFELIVGGAALLFDTYGYHRGEVGVWLGAKLVGLDVRVARRVAVLVDFVDVSLPAFHVSTMPFIYPQWRWSLGVGFY